MISNNLAAAGTGQGATSSSAVDEGSRARSASRRARERGNDFSSVLRGLGADPARGASGQGRGAVAGTAASDADIETGLTRIDGRRQKGRAGAGADGGDAALTSDWSTRDLAAAAQAGARGGDKGGTAGRVNGATDSDAPDGAALVAADSPTAAGHGTAAAGVIATALGAGADDPRTAREPAGRALDPASGMTAAPATDAARASARPGRVADSVAGSVADSAVDSTADPAAHGVRAVAGMTQARRGGVGGAGVTAGIDGAAGDGGKAGRTGSDVKTGSDGGTGSDGRTAAARDVEARQLDQRLAVGQTVAGKAASDVAATARRREEGIAVDRSAVERLVTERMSVSRASGAETAGAGAAGSSANQADGESAGAAATRKEAPTIRRPANTPSRLLAGDIAMTERAASADASARPASTSTVELASADGKAFRSVTEREPFPGAAASQARAQDLAVSLAPAPTLSMPTPSGVPSVVVEPSLTDPAFAQALGQQVRLLVDGEISVADMVVTPAEMGPVRIELTVRGDNADVVFTAAAPETLRAIEASGEVLRSMLAEQGISLGSMDVGQGQARSSGMANGDGASHRQHGADGATTAATRGAGAESTAHTPPSAAHRRGIVDLIA